MGFWEWAEKAIGYAANDKVLLLEIVAIILLALIAITIPEPIIKLSALAIIAVLVVFMVYVAVYPKKKGTG